MRRLGEESQDTRVLSYRFGGTALEDTSWNTAQIIDCTINDKQRISELRPDAFIRLSDTPRE
jgi:hypothetical protein